MSTASRACPARTRWPTSDAAGFLATLVSYQHPDHDTDNWPPEDTTMSRDRSPAAASAARCASALDALHRQRPSSAIAACARRRSAISSAALVGAPKEAVDVDARRAGAVSSSEHVERGFCSACGTPLFYNDVERPAHHAHHRLARRSASGCSRSRRTASKAACPGSPSCPPCPTIGETEAGDSAAWAARDQGDQSPASRPRHAGMATAQETKQ